MRIRLFILYLSMNKLIVFALIACFGFCRAQNPEKNYAIKYDGHLSFEVSFSEFNIDGQFVFDTGASNLYIDTLFYRNNKFPNYNLAEGVLKGVGTGEKKVDVMLTPLFFKLNHQRQFKSDTTVILDLKNSFGHKVDGVIGLNFFREKVIKINYPRETIQLFDALPKKHLSDYKRIPLFYEKNRLFTTCKIELDNNTHLEGKFIIDTGNPDAIDLNAGVVNINQVDKKIKYQSSGGIGGDSKGFTFLAKEVNFDGFTFSEVTTDLSLNKSGALSNSQYTGIIGNGLLERFDVILDKKNRALYLRPNTKFPGAFHKSKLGFSFSNNTKNDAGWIVNTVYENSNAAKNGLELHDEILNVNGTPVRFLDGKLPRKSTQGKLNLLIQRNRKIQLIRFRPENIIHKLKN